VKGRLRKIKGVPPNAILGFHGIPYPLKTTRFTQKAPSAAPKIFSQAGLGISFQVAKQYKYYTIIA